MYSLISIKSTVLLKAQFRITSKISIKRTVRSEHRTVLLIEITVYSLNKIVSINSTVSKIFQIFLLKELFDLKIKELYCLTNSSFNRNHRVL